MTYKVVTTFLLSLFFAAFIYAQDSPQTPSGSAFCAQQKSNSPNSFIENINIDIKHSFNVLDYKINLDLYSCFITPYPKSFTGSVIVKFQVDSTLNSIKLNAVTSSLQIDSVSMSAASFSHASNILTLTLERTYNPGEIAETKIYYKHKNVSDNAVYVSGGFFFTDCEPEGARKWFPCWDKPSDKATLDLTAKVPTNVKLASNGRLADSVKTTDAIYYHWISRDPIATYLMVLTGKVNYNLDILYWHKLSNPADSVPMRFYWNAGENASSVRAMENTVLQMTTAYSQLFGEHPFEKNGFASLNNQFSLGGMENQTLTSICPNCWYESLIAHEYAHQWFGDMITCATWADIWLNEGFATYTEALWIEHKSGYSAYKSEINSDASTYLSSNPGWAISNPAWAVTTPNTNTLFNYAITYQKGACVFHLLRYVVGDQAFFQGVYNYANDPALKYKSAVISDFKDHLSAAYGEDLSWFFDEWIYQPNHPVYANNYWIASVAANLWQVGFVAKQTQTNTPFHKMPIEVKISFISAPDTVIRVMNDANNQVYTWQFNHQPSGVSFDPYNNIVLKQASISVIPPLPVEFTSFTGTTKNSFVLLDWSTATEINNRGFEIERAAAPGGSHSGNNSNVTWQKVGSVDGSGTTSLKHNYSFTDFVAHFGTYVYRLKQIDYDGSYKYSPEIEVAAGLKPESYLLNQNYPNPFNPVTTISYELPEASLVSLKLYDILGREVAQLINDFREAGRHQVTFNSAAVDGLTSGVYFYKIEAGSFTAVKKMQLLK
ncbi:MAG: T9SS type A sorting domain-containing protein [Ignavibacteriaceae bacterium]|nr:T9SS type A sorting domain-containing protein [Ignavibacteriaceae bacterium]